MCKCNCNPFDQSDPAYEAWLSEREARERCARREKKKEAKNADTDK